ncbi:hypothetical protein SDC9_144510 [bioreactor metagenome]|uniref:Uncharacterized protein n=1 Tax=bioreactor metagenome TaxID=1076179 RepID=A0A645E6E1_9ZZZZ
MICTAKIGISSRRCRSGGMRITLFDKISYNSLLNTPLSVNRLRSLSQAAIIRTSIFLLISSLTRELCPLVSTSVNLSATLGGIFSISSKNSVPPLASSSLPGRLSSPSATPNSSNSINSGVRAPHITEISGPAARPLA